MTSHPPLPIPSLEDTLDRYRASLKAVLSGSKLAAGEAAVDEFLKSPVAAKLQAALEQRASTTPNWLEEWWEEIAYLKPRYATAINVNPAAVFQLPPAPQLQRAARILHFAGEYVLLQRAGRLPKEELMGQPLDMFQYQRLHGTWREPGVGGDSIRGTPGTETAGRAPESGHVVIIVDGRYFSVQVLEKKSTRGGGGGGGGMRARSIEAIHRALHEIMETVSRVFAAEGTGEGIGALTSCDNRDDWARAKEAIKAADARNAASLEEIDTALCLLSLEGEEAVEEDADIFARCLAGPASSRWFDKVCYVVFRNGKCGANGEHSQADAIVAVIAWTWTCNQVAESEARADTAFFTSWRGSGGGSGGSAAPAAAPYRLLQFKLPARLEAQIGQAVAAFDMKQQAIDTYILKFRTFGKQLLKWCRLPPDAFIQMAIQLAYARITDGYSREAAVPVYETAHTRLFHHGRTSTIRSCSTASRAFVEAMGKHRSREEFQAQPETAARLRGLLAEALQRHTNLTAEALQGQDVDRHLLGLQIAAMGAQVDPLPKLFTDASYAASGGGGTYVISSSNATAGDQKVIGGFMPMVEHGVGVCYFTWNSELHFVVTTWKGAGPSTAQGFAEAIRGSLNDMILLNAPAVEQSHWSKL